ncbi:suppressor of fused domain protein [Mucilaginibacter sp. Mucisp84]|uniref:suppressor of fused domain protein n=1 Tax=Mucilaginibacter sp. Mucisp84 TaxID=3243058 RepID=UPI0039A41420
MMSIYNKLIKEHYISNWGSNYEEKIWTTGPINELDNTLTILEFKPTDNRKMWTYATCGMSTFSHEKPVELHLFSAIQNSSILELLTSVVYFHNLNQNLNLGHTVNFGRPWQENSECSYGLISLPYLDGPDLELFDPGNNHKTIFFYWLIPITLQERNYKMQNGLDALEEKLEESQFNYIDSERRSVI